MSSQEQQSALFSKLKELGIETRTIEHKPVFTVEESKELRGIIPGGHCKNLFLKARKGQLYLVVALEDTPINLKKLSKKIGEKGLSFANEGLLLATLGVKPGSVSPFGLMHDKECQVKVILDKKMLEEEILNYHPLLNGASTAIKPGDLLLFIRACGHETTTLSFDSF